MDTRKTTKETEKGKFTNMKCEYCLIFKAISQTPCQNNTLSMPNR